MRILQAVLHRNLQGEQGGREVLQYSYCVYRTTEAAPRERSLQQSCAKRVSSQPPRRAPNETASRFQTPRTESKWGSSQFIFRMRSMENTASTVHSFEEKADCGGG